MNKGIFKKVILPIGVLAILVAIVLGLWFHFSPKTTEGSKTAIIEVVYSDGKTESFDVKTDAEFLKEAADKVLNIEGDESEYGFMIHTINGEKADFSVDQSYWAIYVNDEYANYGVSQLPVNDGDKFSFKYEKSAS